MEISQTSSSGIAAATASLQQAEKLDTAKASTADTNSTSTNTVQISAEARSLLEAEQSGPIETQSSGSQAEKPR